MENATSSLQVEGSPVHRFPPYSTYRASGVEWLGEIPAHWKIRRLKTVAVVQASNVDKKSLEGEEPVRLCNYTDVYYNARITADIEFMPASATTEQVRRFTLCAGDVLITKDSESWTDIAVSAVVEEDLPGVLCGYLLYEIQSRLAGFPIYTESDVEAFAKVYFDAKATQDRLYAVLAPVVDRSQTLPEEERHDFRGHLTDYVRLYSFLAQVLTFADADLEKLYVFARHLRRLLPADRAELPREVQQNIDMESYRIQQTGSGTIALERRPGVLEPVSTKQGHGTTPGELETLSRIIAELNDRFGLNLGPEHRVTLGQMMEKLDDDAAARVNTRENVRLTFDQKVEHVIQEIVDSNFELYRRITDDRAFGEAIKNFLFDQYFRAHRNAEELIERGESKTLEFKSTLRWSLKEGKKDDTGVTHAVLKTVAAFLNTEGGDLLIGVADDGQIVGIEHDRTVCVVSCQRSPEPVFLKWKGMEAGLNGDFFVRSGPGTVKLPPDSASEYIRTRFAAFAPQESPLP